MLWLVGSNASATTAKEWLALSADEQRGFVSGTMEAYAYAGSIALSAGQTRLGDFLLQPLNCIVSLNLGSPAKEVHALVLRYMKAHSETAGQDAARVVRVAVLASCDKPGTK